MKKVILGIITLLIFTGCSEISSQQCIKLGYTYGMENIFGTRIGCVNIKKNIVYSYNIWSKEKYIIHIEDAGQIHLLD